MKTKHTPGPWECCQDHPTTNEIANIRRNGHEGYGSLEIAQIYCVKYGCERLANARLIAAAPELLEALVTLVDVIDEWPQLHKNGDYLHGYPLMNARKAIAKATEETP